MINYVLFCVYSHTNLIAYNLSLIFFIPACFFFIQYIFCTFPTRYKTIWNIYFIFSFLSYLTYSFRSCVYVQHKICLLILWMLKYTQTHSCFNINLLSHTLSTDLRKKIYIYTHEWEMNENLPMRNKCLEDLIFHLLFFAFFFISLLLFLYQPFSILFPFCWKKINLQAAEDIITVLVVSIYIFIYTIHMIFLLARKFHIRDASLLGALEFIDMRRIFSGIRFWVKQFYLTSKKMKFLVKLNSD